MANAVNDDKSGMSGRRRFVAGLLGGAAFAAGLSARAAPAAANWPGQPIRLVVGYPPGGGTDTVARLLAQQFAESLGQQVVVENRPGASSTIATQQVARSAPDGYTILFATASPLTGAPLTMKGLQYDPMQDLDPITLVGNGPFILVANPAFPPNSLPELVEYARQHPGEVNYASPGNSTANYFFCELLNMEAGIKTVNVPYKGSSALVNDLIGGYVQYTLETPGTTLPLIRQGKLKALAILHHERLSKAPEIPTAAEEGFPQLVGGSWYGLLAPAGTPRPVIDKIQQATVAALQSPAMRTALDERDVLAQGNTPEEFREFIQAEYRKWKDVTTRIGIKPQ
ncbi:Bug family tripartite tricarboxylate transporter substrate binding protein [Bordetella petrii]|uniref:Bug family tripartite tricarboxylate transporter substrate binding protein n=1 Tax=Bordetella petrii TaxID=94624 RepID=UPI001E6069DF|nr:tripartite tricarboxylate transporter substrate binding protein [Bordetella petrii]MCD0502416.1 tripartite tricarboxylate transporter substrate binding protein [Bordetella petrii]